jgi:hypothetical protein
MRPPEVAGVVQLLDVHSSVCANVHENMLALSTLKILKKLVVLWFGESNIWVCFSPRGVDQDNGN